MSKRSKKNDDDNIMMNVTSKMKTKHGTTHGSMYKERDITTL